MKEEEKHRGLIPPAPPPPCAVGSKCGKDGTHNPVLLLVPTKGYRGSPWRVKLDVPFCKEHQLDDAEEYLTDDAWLQIVAMARARGQLPPKRSLSKVEFAPIGTEGRA
jgi:hypothetical protein